jgi:cyanophycinase-like exopeptidase
VSVGLALAGRVGLHGGAEFQPGDERFLARLLEAARPVAALRDASGIPTPDDARGTVRLAIVPSAAAGHGPGAAGRFGADALTRVAAAAGFDVRVDVVEVVDAASADDRGLAATLAAADLVHLPGGDPALVPAILAGTAAWRAIVAARARGAVLAGASAGAMGLCDWTWTQGGVRRGLGVVHGLVVVPHFDTVPRDRWEGELEAAAAAGVGLLGLDERTGVLSEPTADGAGSAWRVAGEGAAHWVDVGAHDPVDAGDGEVIVLERVTISLG